MIYFDNRNHKILKAVYRHDGITSKKLHSRFDNCEMFLIELAREFYIGAEDENGNRILFSDKPPFHTSAATRWFCLPRGNCVIEERRWRIIQWTIPVAISVSAFLVSLLSHFS